MRKKLYISLLFVLLLTCISCQSDIDRFQQYLDGNEHLKITSAVDFVIIIPGAGCGGCISYVEEFYKENKDLQSVVYIFTSFISKKMLALKIGATYSANTYIDEENEVMDCYPRDKKIYPCILEIADGVVKNIYYQSPDEDGLSIVKQNER